MLPEYINRPFKEYIKQNYYSVWLTLQDYEKEFERLLAKGESLILHCPECHTQHIDKNEWAVKLHKTHLCENCHHEWKPFLWPTFGVFLL